MDTAAHDASSSDLDESGLEHVFVCGMKENTCNIMPGNNDVFHNCSFLHVCVREGGGWFDVILKPEDSRHQLYLLFFHFKMHFP